MSILGNVLWLLLGGFIVAMCYFIVGALFCLTIIGIPFGMQLFKFGMFALSPFGYEAVFKGTEPGCLSLVMNILWVVLGWWEIALTHLTFGLILCCTIVGIPFGIQHFKMAILGLFPFGKTIVPKSC